MASLRTIFLSSYLFILLPFVLAVPSDIYHSSCNNAVRPTKSFVSVIRDSVIQRFWGLPAEYQRSSSALSQPASAAAPPNLRAQYGGDVVLRFNVSSNEEMKALADAAETLYLDVWESTEQWVDIRLAKEVVSLLLGLLPESLHTAHTPLMHDLAQAIYESYPSSSSANQQLSTLRHEVFTPSLGRLQDEPSGERDIFFRDYQPMSVIMPWMRLMASLFPTHTRMFNIGYSYEGRDIPALKVGVHPTNSEQPSEPRRTILLVGGGHAREWISTSTITYIVYQMITGYGKSQEITKLLEEFDWVFVPTINPDGYVYTWDIDRLWRKNRQQTDLRFCQGVDLDRAWSFQWDGASTRSNPCSESYAGIGPFDGVEARRLADWAKNETEKNNVNFVAFLDLHSYSQQVLYPYSFSCQSTPPSLENLEELAMGLAKSIRLTNNHFYGVNSACNGGGLAAQGRKKGVTSKMDSGGGSALDWFYHEMGVKYAYQIKLRDTGSYGFLLPRENIIPTGKETLNAVTGLGRFLLGNRGIENSLASYDEEASADRPEESRFASPVDTVASEASLDAGGSEDEQDEPQDEYIHQPELRRRRRR